MTELSHGHGQPHAYVTAGEDDPRTKATTLDHGHGTEHAYVTANRRTAASARPEWADGDFTAKNGDLYHTVTEDKAVTMRTPSGSMAGYVNWGDNDVIGNMNVREEHQRRGIATELLRRAREQRPELQHSDRLSNDAQAWLKGIGERHGSPKAAGLSDEDRVSVAENVMEGAGHTGRHWHVPAMHQDDPARVEAHRPVHEFVNQVLNENGHPGGIRVHPRHWDLRTPGSGQATTDGLNYIGLAGEHTHDLTLLHEIAHILTGTGEGRGGHGPAFQDTAHRLYQQHLGPEAAETFARLIPPANRRTAERIKMNLEDMDKFLHHQFGVGKDRTGREEIHPKSGWPVDVGEHRSVAPPPEGKKEGPAVWDITDHGEFPNRPMFPNRNIRQDPITHVYRGVSADEWKQAQERGYIKSDQRGTIADWEGTNAGAHPQTAMSYLPRNNTGHILKIRTHPDDKWFTIKHDTYLRTREKIPLDRVEHVSPPIHRDDWYHYVDADRMPKTAAAEHPPVLRHEDLDRHIGGYEKMGPVDRSHQPYLSGAQFHFHPSFPLEHLDHYPAPPEELAEDDEQEDHYHDLQHAIMNRPQDVPPIIVVQHPTHHQILDGNHRVSLALDADVSHLPAYVYPHNPGKTAADESPSDAEGDDAIREFAKHGIEVHDQSPVSGLRIGPDRYTEPDPKASLKTFAPDHPLHTEQDFVHFHAVREYVKHGHDWMPYPHPEVVRHGGKDWIQEGHHRIIASRIRGEPITVWHRDLDADMRGKDAKRHKTAAVRMVPPEEYQKFHYPDYPKAKNPAALVKHFKKTSPEYFEKIKKDVQENGFTTPVLVRWNDPRGKPLRKPEVMEGHHRAAVAHELGMHLPVGDYESTDDYDTAFKAGQDWWRENQRPTGDMPRQGSAEKRCPCGLPVEFDPSDGWQHLDGSISHDGDFYGKSVSDLMKEGKRAVAGESLQQLIHSYRGAPLAQRTSTPEGAAGWCEDVTKDFANFAAARGHRVQSHMFNYPSRQHFPNPHPAGGLEPCDESDHWDGWHHAPSVDGHVVDWSLRQFDGAAKHPHVEPLDTYRRKFAYDEPMHHEAKRRTLAKRWTPSRRIFGPTHGLDHRLFDGDHLKPDVRDYILSTLDGFWRPLYGPSWRRWAKVYFAGSEASEWTSETLEGNNDFDVLIGVDYDKMRGDLDDLPGMRRLLAMMTDEQITNGMNTQFRDGLNPRTAKAMIVIDGKPEGPFENTWYVNPNSYDIRNIRPYAAYDVTADEWAVKPPSLPDWDISQFPEGKGMTQEVHGIIEMAKGILRMPEPYRTQNGRALWQFVHANRSDAFGPQGEGWYDSRNVIEKALDQAGLMHPLWELMDKARQDPHTLDAPAGWSNTPSITPSIA